MIDGKKFEQAKCKLEDFGFYFAYDGYGMKTYIGKNNAALGLISCWLHYDADVKMQIEYPRLSDFNVTAGKRLHQYDAKKNSFEVLECFMEDAKDICEKMHEDIKRLTELLKEIDEEGE